MQFWSQHGQSFHPQQLFSECRRINTIQVKSGKSNQLKIFCDSHEPTFLDKSQEKPIVPTELVHVFLTHAPFNHFRYRVDVWSITHSSRVLRSWLCFKLHFMCIYVVFVYVTSYMYMLFFIASICYEICLFISFSFTNYRYKHGFEVFEVPSYLIKKKFILVL